MNQDMMTLCNGFAFSMRYPQANRPIQGRGHWRTPVQRLPHPEQH
ncbi:hypothetical protein [uncultured Photobacterium sp.]|nr:hypothetical protein [uncultured Photobacterium sp.]